MKLKNTVEKLLETNKLFRERHLRMQEIAYYLCKKYQLNINPYTLEEILYEANSMDRFWRMILAERPDLQGNDYNSKKATEEKYEIENLGYEPQPFKKQMKLL